MLEIDKQLLSISSIVQMDPDLTRNQAFAGCLLVITEIKSWGVQGYVQALGESRSDRGGQAYYRAKWDEFEPTGGLAMWMVR